MYHPPLRLQQCRNCTNYIGKLADNCRFCGVSIDATVEEIVGVEGRDGSDGQRSSKSNYVKVLLAYDRQVPDGYLQ